MIEAALARLGTSTGRSSACSRSSVLHLDEVGLPTRAIPVALLFFNVGVEMAMTTRLARRWAPWAQDVPSYAIGSMAMFWGSNKSTRSSVPKSHPKLPFRTQLDARLDQAAVCADCN